MISEMNSQMIIHQPYRTLTSLQPDLGLSQDEVALAWSIINDHYMTDLPLLYPPHVITLTAILLSLVLRPAVPGSQGNVGGTGSATAANMNMAAASAALAQAQARAAIQGGGGSTSGAATPLPSPGGSGGQLAAYQQQQQQLQLQHLSQGDSAAREKTQDNRSKIQRFAIWLGETTVDIEAMIDCTQELISFYEFHEQYNEKNTREQINRFVKARGLDR